METAPTADDLASVLMRRGVIFENEVAQAKGQSKSLPA